MAHSVKGTTLYLALWRATREVQLVAEANIAQSGLGLSDFAVLEALYHKGPQRIAAIAEKVMLTSGSMTAAIDRLADKSLVSRVVDEQDARARLVELTDAGRALIGPIFSSHEHSLSDAVGGLSEDERSDLLKLLLKLRSTLRHTKTK